MTTITPKSFNVAGPCVSSDHYMLPALPRLPDVRGLVAGENYFILHAPRQSGKTTTMMAAVDQINEEGSHYALYCTLEKLRGVSDKSEGMRKLAAELYGVLVDSRIDALRKAADESFWATLRARLDFGVSPVQVCLKALCAKLDKDLAVFFDEADCLQERVLLSFLSQLRAGYVQRSETPFPRSIALIGMSAIRDYKVRIRAGSESMVSGSPFNIVKKTLTLPDFTAGEIKDLYAQHTEATGQIFEDEAVQRAWYWSEGQPWLVNALARQAIEKILNRDYGPAITEGLVDEAAEALMVRRDTHVDSLLARLHDRRVWRIIEPMLALSEDSALALRDGETQESFDDDLQYCLDLGLVKWDDDVLRPANPIYSSVIARYLVANIQKLLPRELIGKWMDGRSIDMTGLLKEFQRHWAPLAEKYLAGLRFAEAGPHMLLFAFLQRVVSGGAQVIPEFADGAGYADLVIPHAGRKYVIEVKIKGDERSRDKTLERLLGYMDPLLAEEGWVVIFDRDPGKSRADKITWKTVTTPAGQTIHVVGC